MKELELTASVDVYNAKYADKDWSGNEVPFAIFHFHYRSLEALHQLHVVERTPEVYHLEDADIETMSVEALRKLVRGTLRRDGNQVCFHPAPWTNSLTDSAE